MKKIFLFCIPFAFLLFQSCATYYISAESLKQQLSVMPDSTTKMVRDKNSIEVTIAVGKQYYQQFNNGIKKIECTDKNGRSFKLSVQPGTQIILINKRGFGQTFFFETLKLKGDSMFTGNIDKKSGVPIAAKFSNIEKVKVLHPLAGEVNKVK